MKYFNDNALLKTHVLINLPLLKYGRNNFTLDIIEYCYAEDVIKRKQLYLDKLKPQHNTLKQAGSSYGYKHRKESLLKISNRTVSLTTLANMRNRIQTEKTKNKIKKSIGIPVLVVNTNIKEKAIYKSKSEAALVLGVSDSTIGGYITLVFFTCCTCISFLKRSMLNRFRIFR